MTNPHQQIWHQSSSVISEADHKHLAIVGEYLEGPPQLLKHKRVERDPDYDNIDNIYARLSSKSPSPRRSRPVHTTCECHKRGPTPGSGKHGRSKETSSSSKHGRSSEKGSSSGEDSEEEEDVDLGVLLKMLDGLSKRPDSKISCQAFQGVLEGFSCQEALKGEEVDKVCQYLESESLKIKEMAWCLISKLCENVSNVVLFLERDLVRNITQGISNHSPCLGPCLETLINVVGHESLKDDWYEPVLSDFVPLLLTALSMEDIALEHKYRIGCFFHSLGKEQDFLGIIENRVLPILSGMRNSSSKLKEIYTKILGVVVKNEDSSMSGSVDQGVTTVAVSMLKEGPCDQQIEALSLLCILSDTDKGRTTVINDDEILPIALACVQHSKCRFVRQRALVLMNHVTMTRRLGLCKEVMTHLSRSLLPGHDTDRVQVGVRQEREGRLWRGLDSYVEMLAKLFCKEAKMERNSLQKVKKCCYRPGCDVQVLVSCSSAILNVCLWAAHRNKQDLNSLDLSSFTDCEVQRKKYWKINRALVQMVWDSFGDCMFELLSIFARKLRNILDLALQAREGKNLCSEHEAKSASGLKVLDRLGFADLYAVFDEREVDLIVILLELVLVMSLCSCKSFSDLFPTSAKSNKKSSAANSKSDSPTQGFQPRPGSPLKSRPTSAIGLSSVSEEERRQGLKQKEISAERRLLRKCLYEQDVMRVVLPFIQCSQSQCQVLSCEILRANIQAIEEREITLNSLFGPTNASASAKLRPHSAVASISTDLRLQQALHTMSPHVAHIIKDALGTRMAPSTPHVIPRVEEEPDTNSEAVSRLSQYVIDNRPKSRQTDPIPEVPKPVLDPVKPVALQCRDRLLQEGGSRILTPLFASSLEVKKLCALLLGDLVRFGNVEVHMTLSQLGCMQKLLDFLRTNTNNELIEIIGLIIVQMLVKSDKRIEEVFNHYGGTRLLMAMVKFTSGDLKKQAISTLKTVTRGTKKNRPTSAPASTTKKAPDVWDKIQQQWAQQDKVEEVLHQWYR